MSRPEYIPIETILAYRAVFSTPEGRSVLLDLLAEAEYFGEIDKESIEVHNFVKRILGKCGINHTLRQMEGMVDALIDQPIPEQPEVNDEDLFST